MALNAKKVPGGGGGMFDPVDAGTYPARLCQIIDLGLQPQRPYNGTVKPPAYEIQLCYELVDEFAKDEDGEDIVDKPRWLFETLPLRNLEADKANSTQRYYALDAKEEFEGDWTKLIDTPCMVTTTIWEKKGKSGNNVTTISSMRAKDVKGCPPLINKPLIFNLDEPDMEIFGNMSDYMKGKIMDNLEFKGSTLDKALGGAEDAGEDGEAEKRGDDKAW